MNNRISVAILFLVILLQPVFLYSKEVKTISVRGVEGRGENEQIALNSAFRNAIRKAIGSYVVSYASTDGKTLDKKVFDNCDAVVSNYKVVEQKEENGRVLIVIDAEIVRNEMVKYIQKTTSTEVEKGELANLLVKRNAINNAVKSLDLVFMNWRDNIYRAEKYGDLSIAAEDNAEGNEVKISIPFILTFNWQSYEIFISKVRNILTRIAIDRKSASLITTGDWSEDNKRLSEIRESIEAFFIKAGVATRKRNGDLKYENSNNYGAVLIISHEGAKIIRGEFFIVPQQIRQKLSTILNPDAEVRFLLSNKGGGTIASRFISREVRSFGWETFWGSSRINNSSDIGWDEAYDSHGVAIISDKILFGNEWTQQRIFRATISIPLSIATRVASCSISVCPKSEGGRTGERGSITSETVSEAEWVRADRKPHQRVFTYPHKTNAKQQNPPQKEKSFFSAVIPISKNDKNLKIKVDKLRNSPPDLSSADGWFRLSGEVESSELKQEMLKAAGMALICAKKGNVYRDKIRPHIHGVSEFEESFFRVCPSCNGGKQTSKECTLCSGDGICRYANCREGKHLVHQIDGNYYENCRECRGTAKCQKCSGTGKMKNMCRRCRGRGRIMNSDFVAGIYQETVQRICNAF